MKLTARYWFSYIISAVVIFTALSARGDEGERLNIVLTRLFSEVHDLDTFAFVVPLYVKKEQFSSLLRTKADASEMLRNSDYVLVYTPHKAKVNDIWYLLEIDRLTLKAQVIGRGGNIEYLNSNFFDAPGFDENDHRRCAEVTIFPQRRLQSCKQIDCRMTLHLNGRGSSSSYTLLQGKNGWHILKTTEDNNTSKICVFDIGEASNLLNIGKSQDTAE